MVSVVKTVKNTERLRQILTVLVKHGFGELVDRTRLSSMIPGKAGAGPQKSIAIRLREAMQELGPSFVKLGQIISTRPDVIPEDIIVELKKLQDNVQPLSAAEVKEVLEETFGGTDADIFAWFDETPLASASIGQVHCARLREPTADNPDREIDVVVKVQRPRIRRTIERDLDLLYLLASLLERHIPEAKIYSPTGMVAEFDRAIMAELDFSLEADHADRFARNFAGDPVVRFPHVYRHASSKRVLTMERFVGSKIYAFARDPEVGKRVAKQALHVVATMTFEHGFFHADPHPGNIIMLGSPQSPVIGLIDLGLVGRLSPDLRDKAIQLMFAAVLGNGENLADALLGMGRPRGRVDMPAFRAEVQVLSEKYLGKPLAEVEMSALIRDLVQGAIKYDIEMPVEMLMVGKALMTVEGIGKELDPELDVFAELKPFFVRLLRARYSPERLGKDLLRALSQLGSSAGSLPGTVTDILADLRAGHFKVNTVDPAREHSQDRLGRRVFTGLVVASLLLAGAAMLAAGRHQGTGVALVVLAVAQLMFHVAGDWWRNRDR